MALLLNAFERGPPSLAMTGRLGVNAAWRPLGGATGLANMWEQSETVCNPVEVTKPSVGQTVMRIFIEPGDLQQGILPRQESRHTPDQRGDRE